MKKFISLIAIVAVMMCLSLTSFASNEAPFSFATDNIDVALGEGTENVDVTLGITFDSDVVVGAANITFDTDGLAVAGIDSAELSEYVPYDAGGSVPADGMITHIDMTNFATGTIPAGKTVNVVATLTVDKSVEAVYTITLTGDTLILGDDFGTPINDGATYPTATITVKAADPEPTINTIAPTEVVDVAAADKIGEDATDYEIGSGLGMSVSAGETIFNKMIWAITVDGARKYSAPVALGGVSGDFKVAATFINGNKVDNNTQAFSEVGAIFQDSEGADWFTNEDDAANKAE